MGLNKPGLLKTHESATVVPELLLAPVLQTVSQAQEAFMGADYLYAKDGMRHGVCKDDGHLFPLPRTLGGGHLQSGSFSSGWETRHHGVLVEEATAASEEVEQVLQRWRWSQIQPLGSDTELVFRALSEVVAFSLCQAKGATVD